MKPVSIVVLAAAVAAGGAGCATLNPGGNGGSDLRMSASPAIPSAEADVKVAKASNDNTSIDLSVKHLALPEKLTPPENVYVVWVRSTKDAPAQNIGALTVNQNLDGKLETVTALRHFDLFVTAEPSGQVQQPTGQPLLWTSYNG
jgi:hypothetical protein